MSFLINGMNEALLPISLSYGWILGFLGGSDTGWILFIA